MPAMDAQQGSKAHGLYWGETGPSVTGTAETSHTFTVNTSEHRMVCALVALNVKHGEKGSRVSAAMFDATATADAEPK